MDNKVVKVINVTLVIMSIISIIICGTYIYYHFFVKPNHVSVGVNYIGDQTPTDILDIDNLSESQLNELQDRTLFEFNYLDNTLNNGLEVCELKVNSFTDNTLNTSTCRSVGLQGFMDYSRLVDKTWLVDRNAELIKYINSADDALYCYSRQDDISWAGEFYGNNGSNSVLNNDSKFIVSIDNNPYLIELNGYHSYIADKEFLGIKIGTETKKIDLSWYDLFLEIMYAVKTNSKGYSQGYLIFDCSDYFKDIKAYNPDTKLFDKVPDVDISKNYCYVKFNYSNNGLTNSSQSLFKVVKGDANYGMTDSDIIVKDYWKAMLNYTLDFNSKINNKNVFEFKYVDDYKGYFVYINLDTKIALNSIPDKKINIYLNLQDINISKGFDVVGIYVGGFQNCKIDTITIEGTGNFTFLSKSLVDTNIKTIKHNSSLYLDFLDSSTNNVFEVVEL